ncbi:GGDEF domain-containing protein [Sporosarcina sp. NPDC096371]|uniref:GGDEF domain-containing protein n=1 Tax=Sporosarcina sp. NPDC096371 TaxID=3364530 RepID=UPI00382F90B9
MSVQQLAIHLLVHGIPGVVLFGVACIIITQNYKSTTNRLIAVLISLYSFIFFEELIRFLLPPSYNSIVLHLSFGSISILIISITFHFFIHIAKLPERINIRFYPVICYLPFFINLGALPFTNNYLTGAEITQKGIWNISLFNLPHYVTLTIANMIMLVFLGILWNGLKHTTSISRQKILRLFILGTCFGMAVTILFEYLIFGWALPSQPFRIMAIIFPALLAIAALKFNLVPSAVSKYQTMFNLIPTPITVVNSDWEILELNDYSRAEIFRHGDKPYNMLDFVQADENKEVLHTFIDLLQTEVTLHGYPLALQLHDNQGTLHYSVEASTVILEDEKIFYLVWRNVTQDIENDSLIEHLAYHDVLTSLHNRAYFVPKVKERMMKLSAGSQKESALVLIDLNRFKRINDTFGHAIGDQVLQHSAMLLKQTVRADDLVARLGGDEFVVFLEDFPSQRTVFDWNDRLQNAFQQNPFETGSITIQIELSVGIAFFPKEADNFENLFQLADWNMYEHKLVSRENDSRMI